MSRQRLNPQTGTAFRLRQGELLTVWDPEGEQVADLFCFEDGNPSGVLSSGRSIDYNDTIFFSKGHFLYSFAGDVMLEIVEDSCGRHDFLVTPCSLQMFRMLAKDDRIEHPSCQHNLEVNLAEFGFDPTHLGTSFNIFMNVEVDNTGRVRVSVPRSKAGDRVVFKAHRDLVVGLTACSDEGTNNGRCKPIEYEIGPKA
ncbi:MAG: urea carboxylase-associated family protein [Bdellovibrionaceae bacterium]|nr:urea carboxylase-associated family protein [Pseudobdellovibrionaceae bacterium]